MKQFSLLFIGSLLALAVCAADMPWQTLKAGNEYWANTFGTTPVAPRQRPLVQLSAVAIPPSDASLMLINAAVKNELVGLNSELFRFADSLKHVMMYISGATPRTVDDYDRAGWWGLSYPIAIRYGLAITPEIDERLDFEKSTRAAMLYFRDLKKQVAKKNASLFLAFVHGPIALSRPNANLRADSLQITLRALKKLVNASQPGEAELYAVKSFYTGLSDYRPQAPILIDLVIERTGLPEHVFRALNPELKGKTIPAKRRVTMPALALANMKKAEEDVLILSEARMNDEAQAIAAARTKTMQSQEVVAASTTRTTHKVKSGESLGVLANRFGVGISDLKKWNNLRSDVIYIGQKLIVYAPAREPQVVSTTTGSKKEEAASGEKVVFKDGEYISYKVKNGDTLYSIAKQFPGISPDNLMAWNGISTKIQPGQKIKILKTEISDYDPKRYPDNN